MVMDEQSLGRHLQDARVAKKLTQQELCEKAGIAYSTLAKIERGAIKSPSVFTIQRLAEVLEVTLNDLIPLVHPSKEKKNRPEKFIFFDINGCLVRFYQTAFTELSAESSVPVHEIESLFWRYNNQVCRGDLSLDDFNQHLADLLKVKTIDWKKYYLSAISPIVEAHEVLALLSEHYPIGLLSNIMPGFISTMLEEGYLPTLPYQTIVDSSEVNAIKPEQKIYEIAENQCGYPASSIVFIDDSRANLSAASERNWMTLWFNDSDPVESVRRIKQALLEDNEA